MAFFYLAMMVFVLALMVANRGTVPAWLADWRGSVFSVLAMVAGYLVFEAILGRTPGKLLCGTRVVLVLVPGRG